MTFLTKVALPRRTFLRGVGATVALPLLDAMVPSFTALAQTPATPRTRFGAVFIPNGAIMESWTPNGVGPGFEFSPSLKPLEPFRDSVVVISNLVRAATPGGDHAVSAAGWLTGVGAKRTEAEDILAGITIDQVVAGQIGQDTPFPSLELATEDFTGYIGACTTGYSCAYANTISWSSPTTPLPMEINPRAVFERLFGEPGSPAQRAARRQRDRSILDFVTQETARLRTGSGRAIARGSISISTTSARSSGVSSRRRRTTAAACCRPTRQSAFPSRTKSTWVSCTTCSRWPTSRN